MQPLRPWPARSAALAAALGVAVCAIAQTDLDVPYVTTPQHVVDAMLQMAQVRSSDFLLDLGSGDGRIVISAAKERGARGLGVEIDPRLVILSREKAREAGVADRVRFTEQDLFETDLTQANVITMYLLPDVNLKLRPSLLKLKPGTRVVSHDWDMGDWEPDAKVTLDVPDKQLGLKKESTLMLWKVPANVAGTWSAGKTLSMQWTQTYQKLRGTVQFRGQTFPDATGRIDGNKLHLCFARFDEKHCRLGALGTYDERTIRVIVDGEGRRQLTLVARRN